MHFSYIIVCVCDIGCYIDCFVFKNSCVKALHVPCAQLDNTDGNESDINVVDNDGHTAHHLACLNGHFPVVNYLCTCGADLEAWYVSVNIAMVFGLNLIILVMGMMEHH